MRAVEIRALRGSNSALHYSGSTLSGVTKPIVDPQNAMRFDFTKSAICRRFCKVRLLKHPTGMFYPLRMTRSISSCSIILYLLIRRHCRHLLPRRRLFVSLFFAQENDICCLILFSITDNPHPLSRAMPLTEPSPAEKVADRKSVV